MTVEQRVDERDDQFPVGMRVLAVDDDPTCLMLLDTLLRKCQYHVTTTSHAITALKLLRENKNKFDLVISDVRMPDMDGFKLLELVGLEMDLPVIMLSAYGDTKLVMKGISHGACDYLLKPVRIEELKNIWQHVIRRKTFDHKDQKNVDKPHGESGEVGEGFTGMGDSDQNGKLNRKRKDQNDDEEEEHDENEFNNEDPSTQKKPRVVWSVELHRKFVTAVNQLGIDKAVPKRILELMNVEKLSRENVASHLQKYRLYLKRISCVASQQANMVAALGGADATYLQMSSLTGLGNLQAGAGSGQFQNAAFRSFSPSKFLGRLNTPACLGVHGLSSSGLVQLGHAQNTSNTINDLPNFHPITQSGNQNGNILQGMPMPLELDQGQQNKDATHIRELSTATNDPIVYHVSSGFSDATINVGSLRNSLFGVPNNLITLQGNLQDTQRGWVLGNQTSVAAPLLNSEFPVPLPEFVRCDDNWPCAVQSSGIQSNSFSESFKQPTSSDLRDDISSMAMNMVINSHEASSMTSVPARLLDTRTDLRCQAAPIRSIAGQHMRFTPKQGWDDCKQDTTDSSNLICSSRNSLIPPHGVVGPFNETSNPNSTICHINSDFTLIGQPNFANPLPRQHNEVEQSAMEAALKLKQEYVKEQGRYVDNNVGSLEELVNVMMKQEQDKSMFEEGNFGYDGL